MKLVSKIKSRLGGDLYNRICILSKYKREFTQGSEPSLLSALLEENKYLVTKFLFGTKLALKAKKRVHKNLRSTLNLIYTSMENSNLFDFDGIILPKSSVNGWGLEAEFCNIFLYHFLDNKDLAEAIANEAPYEFGNVIIEKGDVVVDCGANLGVFSAIASHKDATAIYAFEANQVVIEKFLSVTAKYNPNIHICNFAVSNKNEKLEFVFDNEYLGSGKLSFVNPSEAIKKTVTTTVNAITLDEFVYQNKLERVNFIKADIEGAERYMLMGAKQVLKEFAPKLAICTYHLPDDREVIREIILEANPNYVIEEKHKKLYAYVLK